MHWPPLIHHHHHHYLPPHLCGLGFRGIFHHSPGGFLFRGAHRMAIGKSGPSSEDEEDDDDDVPLSLSLPLFGSRLLSTGRSGGSSIVKTEKMTRLGIEPRASWTYTRCS